MTKIQKLFENLTLNRLNIHTVGQGLKALEGKQKDLQAIHIYIETTAVETFRKKKYFHISKINLPSWLDQWIYKNLVTDAEYKKYLEKYKDEIKYDEIDEHILEKHYRKKAIATLFKKKKSFDLDEWTKPRYSLSYRRRTNIELKDGTELHFDFRTHLISLFILNQGQDKRILAIGGGGNSGSREEYTVFTALFYLLGKKKPITHHLLKYDSLNKYSYIVGYKKSIVTYTLGFNYELDNESRTEIEENSILLNDILKKIL